MAAAPGHDRNPLQMPKHLLIVESPAKAKTINKYLGKDFQVLASYGHVRDLVPKTGAVDPDDNFRMKYELIDRNAKHVDAIAKAVKDADTVLLATDPDREGEAIAWHLREVIGGASASGFPTLHQAIGPRLSFKRIYAEALIDPSTRRSHVGVGFAFAR